MTIAFEFVSHTILQNASVVSSSGLPGERKRGFCVFADVSRLSLGHCLQMQHEWSSEKKKKKQEEKKKPTHPYEERYDHQQ
jgi:hypothetical protein